MNAETRQHVETAFQEWSHASRVLWDARNAYRTEPRTANLNRRLELRAAQRVAEENHDAANTALLAIQDIARKEFAAARGWVFGARKERLRIVNHAGGILDHEETLTVACRPAVLTHTYESLKNVRQFAEANSLNAEVLPWSWYYPNGTLAVLFTSRAAP